MSSPPWLWGLLSAALSVAGCGDAATPEAGRTRVSAQFTGDVGELVLSGANPLLWEPYTVEQQRALLANFRWSDTQPLPLPAADATEPPPVYYVQIYARNADELRELDELGIHYDLAPLFEAEWPDASRPVLLPLAGDPEDRGGQFVFALLPALTYNAIRDESLLPGADTYRALIVREVPVEARAADGSVSYDMLGGIAEFAKPHGEMGPDGQLAPLPPVERAATEKRLGRFLRKFVDRVAQATRAAVDGVRRGVGAIARAVAPDAQLGMIFHVQNRAENFTGTLARAWGSGFGQALKLAHTRVNVTQLRGVALYDQHTDASGIAHVTVVRGVKTRICVEADSSAAQMEDGLLWPVRACSPQFTPQHSRTSIALSIDSEAFHALAQFIDAREYAATVLGFTPPKAKVQRGWIANRFSSDHRPFVPCLAATNAPSLVVDALAGALNVGGAVVSGVGSAVGLPIPPIPVGTLVEFTMASDIMLPDGGAEGRAVVSHEYGHFFFCTLLANTSPHAYNMVWSQVTTHALLDDKDSEVRALNEGFADWFAAQVAGGANYFSDPNQGAFSDGDFFFAPSAPSQGRGMESNYGAPLCSEPGSPAAPACQPEDLGALLPTRIGAIATLLQDLIDRANCTGVCQGEINEGAGWSLSGANFTPVRAPVLSADDESIAISPTRIVEAFRAFALSPLPEDELLRFDSFRRLVHDELSPDYSEAQICRLFALHTRDTSCPAETPPVTPPVMTPPVQAPVRHRVSFVELYLGQPWPTDPDYVFGSISRGNGQCGERSCELDAGGDVTIQNAQEFHGSVVCYNVRDGTTAGSPISLGASLTLSNVQDDWDCFGDPEIIM